MNYDHIHAHTKNRIHYTLYIKQKEGWPVGRGIIVKRKKLYMNTNVVQVLINDKVVQVWIR